MMGSLSGRYYRWAFIMTAPGRSLLRLRQDEICTNWPRGSHNLFISRSTYNTRTTSSQPKRSSSFAEYPLSRTILPSHSCQCYFVTIDYRQFVSSMYGLIRLTHITFSHTAMTLKDNAMNLGASGFRVLRNLGPCLCINLACTQAFNH